jgi:hypothetical protein
MFHMKHLPNDAFQSPALRRSVSCETILEAFEKLRLDGGEWRLAIGDW